MFWSSHSPVKATLIPCSSSLNACSPKASKPLWFPPSTSPTPPSPIPPSLSITTPYPTASTKAASTRLPTPKLTCRLSGPLAPRA
ncbi:hypothetical protein V6N11_059964 [Hibiscus sabdariffa]|uniref:Uncharacterized protein n=2 Tax=Hibiscus sabdariffa TaxID=183260 RepID=A0ABR2NYS7_9ROSI